MTDLINLNSHDGEKERDSDIYIFKDFLLVCQKTAFLL